MSSEAFANLSAASAGLHEKLMTKEADKLFTQDDLQKISGVAEMSQLMLLTQELMNHHLLSLHQENGALLFKAVGKNEASKMKNMTADEAMVYSYIAAAGREGIWTKTIKQKTNLHNEVVRKCIKSLESQAYIKQIKNVKYSTRKIYMLASLQPSVQVTGGPWFTDKELDTEFVNGLLDVIWRYAVSFTFPSAFDESKAGRKTQESRPSTYKQYPTVDQIHKFVEESGVCNIALSPSNIKSLCEVLVYDDRLERCHGGYSYKATWQSILKAGGAGYAEADQFPSNTAYSWQEDPCSKCVKFSLCAPKGPVSSTDCVYYDEWLAF